MAAPSWRDFRGSSFKQRMFMDALTLQGDFAQGGKLYMGTKIPSIGFGGAGEAGKTRGLRDAGVEILLCYRKLGFPNRRVGLFAESDALITANHIVKFEEELGDLVDIKKTAKEGWRVRFPVAHWGEGMGMISLRTYAQAHKSSSKRGGEIDSALADELTLCNPSQIGEMMYLCRNAAGLPFASFGWASNPDGISQEHLKTLFVGPNLAFPEVPECRDYTDHDPWYSKNKNTMFFIPAVRADNPAYEANKEAMDRAIYSIHDPTVRRARDIGDWNYNRSTRFGYVTKDKHGFTWAKFLRAQGETPSDLASEQRRQAVHMIQNRDLYGWELWCSFDYGTSDDAASCLLFHLLDDKNRVWTFGERYMVGKQLPEQAREMIPALAEFKARSILGDPMLKSKAAESRTQLTRLQQFAQEGIIISLASNDRVDGWAAIDWLFDRLDDGALPTHTVGFVNYEECPQTWRQLLSAPRKKEDPNDVDKKKASQQFGDHGIDTLRYGWFTRFKNMVGKEKIEHPEYGSIGWMIQQVEVREQTSSSLWF